MKIIVGKNSGYCNGVKYTIDKTIESLDDNNNIYCLGEIVHNSDVVNSLKDEGLIIVNDIHDVPEGSKMIIRAHGVSLETYDIAKKKNIEIIDLTCGKIKIIHKEVLNHNDSFIIVIGKVNHPEVIGTCGHSSSSYVVSSIKDINKCYKAYLNSNRKKVYIVSQTTFNSKEFDLIVDKIKNKFINDDITINKSICNATELRQKEVIDLSKRVDKMIIIGGLNSSNTKELYNLSKDNCDTYLIEDYKDINFKIDEDNTIGIMSGTSTPKEVITKVIEVIKKATVK